MADANERDAGLTRTQTRFLRRIYNGRSIPVIANGRPFLTFREASRYLQSLSPEARDAAYEQMKAQAKSPRHATGG